MPEPKLEGRIYVNEDETAYYTDEDSAAVYVSEDTVQKGGIFYRLETALSISKEMAWQDGVGVLNHIMPDNPGFTIDDAHDWYRRLGIYDSGNVPFADMKLAIARKQSFPLVPLDKQHWKYIQDQLQAAGFDVYVVENRFWDDATSSYITKTPEEYMAGLMQSPEYNDDQYGDIEYGGEYSKIVDYIEDYKDQPFDIGANYRSTFFITGNINATEYNDVQYGDVEYTGLPYAFVLESRHKEFRQLIIKLKGAQEVGFLFVNYIN